MLGETPSMAFPHGLPRGLCSRVEKTVSKPIVLVVEDEPGIADTIHYALASDGFEPLGCASGA